MNQILLNAYAHQFTTACQQATAVMNFLFVALIVLIALSAYHYYKGHQHHAKARQNADHGLIRINGQVYHMKPLQPAKALKLARNYRHVQIGVHDEMFI